MKVLFAVNNENISESIIKKYQANYKEIISGKNVYYFNAIIKELQRDKSYDRVVISEDLEPFSNKNYDMMDKFLFEKLDNISDEASNSVEGEIPIIVICTDRREKGDSMLLKLFSIGVYSALIGSDRTIENVCDLVNRPRNKKEAKVYYKIESDEADYKSENAEDVSETEIQNILIHYKKLGRNEDKYVESFNNIANQYTDGQLRLIANFLPLNVKAVLEEKCPRYQELMIKSVKGSIKKSHNIVTRDIGVPENNAKIDLLQNATKRPRLNNPVVIPNAVNTNNAKKIYSESTYKPVETVIGKENDMDKLEEKKYIQDDNKQNMINQQHEETQMKRGRGRPPKVKIPGENSIMSQEEKKGRGRPRKISQAEENISNNKIEENTNAVNLFDLSNDVEEAKEFNSNVNSNSQQNTDSNVINNNFTGENDFNSVPQNKENTQIGNNDFAVLPGLDDSEFKENSTQNSNNNNSWNVNQPQQTNTMYSNPANQIEQINNDYVPNQQYTANLSANQSKIVAFVGTSKNGTSFLINNLALMLSNKGIKTAVLDLTQNKNAYYIYTKNDENLRNQAINSVEELRRGNANGINVNKNFSVYTAIPNEANAIDDYKNILATLTKNYSLILLDCDFSTDYEYFAQAHEIYLVQTFDVLTIQPLTAFLRELLDRNILDPNKLRVVINKSMKIKGLTKEMIIGGISAYNSPDMTCQKKFFKPDTIMNVTIPFEDQTYSKYLETLATCEVSLNGYSRGLLDALTQLGDMVYPLLSSKTSNNKNYNNYNKKNKTNANNQYGFNSNIDNTLDRMRLLK